MGTGNKFTKLYSNSLLMTLPTTPGLNPAGIIWPSWWISNLYYYSRAIPATDAHWTFEKKSADPGFVRKRSYKAFMQNVFYLSGKLGRPPQTPHVPTY